MTKLQSTALTALLFLSMGGGGALLAEHGTIYGAKLDHFLYFPHFGNSGATVEGKFLKSELVLLVTGEAHPVIYFYSKSGQAISADSIVEITERLTLLDDGALTTADPVAAGGEITISTSGAGEAVSGSVKVLSATSIKGFLRFTLPQGVAGVAAVVPSHKFIVPVQRQLGGINTGVAINNPGDGLLRLDCRLLKDGEELDSKEIDLEAKSQVSQFIDQLFIEADTSDFLGSVRCEGSSRVAAVALELDFLSGATGVFTTLPVISLPTGAGFFISP